jgi:hypothetical protein
MLSGVVWTSFTDDAVRLYSEAGPANPRRVEVLPYFACKDVKTRRYDLVLNQDSFPEIHADVVRDYLAWMKGSARAFCSINHESRPNSGHPSPLNDVSELVRDAGGFERQSRALYWLRKGYVIELYRIVEDRLVHLPEIRQPMGWTCLSAREIFCSPDRVCKTGSCYGQFIDGRPPSLAVARGHRLPRHADGSTRVFPVGTVRRGGYVARDRLYVRAQ